MPCWLASGELDCVFLEDYREKPIGIAQSCTPLGGPNALLASIVLGDYQAKFLDGSYRNPMQFGTLSVSCSISHLLKFVWNSIWCAGLRIPRGIRGDPHEIALSRPPLGGPNALLASIW